MKLERKVKAGAMVQLVSMSDIAFLLIVFFIFSTTFMRESALKVKPPETKVGEELKKRSVGTITVDEEGSTYLDGNPIPLSQLAQELENRLDRPGVADRIVVLKCDKGVMSAIYVPVIEKISAIGATLEIWVDPRETLK